jgi:hypothetical protein
MGASLISVNSAPEAVRLFLKLIPLTGSGTSPTTAHTSWKGLVVQGEHSTDHACVASNPNNLTTNKLTTLMQASPALSYQERGPILVGMAYLSRHWEMCRRESCR